MKGRLNNKIFQYEAERDDLKVMRDPTPSEIRRLRTIDEILRVLYELRR